ncbi:MAG: putative peptidoglycan glycosyltransferase FtsW [Microgenomates group bacterium]
MRKKLAPAQSTVLPTILVVLLCLIGLVFVFEASVAESLLTFGDQYYLVRQHLIGLGVGAIAFLIGRYLNPTIWIKLSPIIFIIGVSLLMLVLIPGLGLRLNGAQRWLSLGPITLQPVEFFKFALVAFFASWLSNHQRTIPFIFLVAIPSVLLMLQPDLGSLLLVLGIAGSMFFIAGGSIKHLLIIGAVAIPAVVLLIATSPYRLERITTFLNPESDPLGASFHIRQITLALGRGGLVGQGLGNSRQRFSYIPEASTDSIFAIVGEEFGFIGSLLIICLYLAFFTSVYKMMVHANQPQAIQLLGFGILSWLGVQVILNLGAVVGLVPLTGVPLPYFSYGRSAQIMLLLGTGIAIRTTQS